MDIREKDIQRFWNKVNVGDLDDCWEWQGSKSFDGYGRLSVSGKTIASHRISWVISNGKIPKDLCVLHRCDNPGCVNPNHLFLGTRKDNVYDAMRKNRRANVQGENAGNSKLTEKDVISIREEYRAGGISQNQLARKYNVTQANIWMVIHRKSWWHI